MKIDNLTLSFKNKIVLRNINLSIKPGEFVFFIGYSGSGKTTLIRSIIGDFKPERGDIVLDNGGFLYRNLTEKLLLDYRRSIGVIFQDYKLMESKSVYENVAFAMEVCGYKDHQIQKKVPQTLEQVGLLTKKDTSVQELSGGEKQRVSIARALVHDPAIIIGDEPTGNLDPVTAAEIMKIFLDLNKDGKTVILATHDKNIVNSMHKRVIVFKDKSIVADHIGGEYNLEF
ncbi:ATP-binding cassette domain-containing protein [Candidatus Gracilibacteria bacterium]|nr:ATP-binding cassette domain-containing protein [Candidatus Gracilibacteria bacterium]